MKIVNCANCSEPMQLPKRSARKVCSICRAAEKPPTTRDEANNALLADLCRAGGAFAEIGLNRLGPNARDGVLEVLSRGGKLCCVLDLALDESSVACARLYLYERGARPLKLGTLAAIGDPVTPQVLN